ncbi:MAG: hypothetical protein WBB82_11090, partial [Limnothrix sp.]
KCLMRFVTSKLVRYKEKLPSLLRHENEFVKAIATEREAYAIYVQADYEDEPAIAQYSVESIFQHNLSY